MLLLERQHVFGDSQIGSNETTTFRAPQAQPVQDQKILSEYSDGEEEGLSYSDRRSPIAS